MREPLFVLLIVAIAAFICAPATSAYGQMPTSDPTGVTTLASCPSGVGFYSDSSNTPTCYSGTISCANTAPIGVTWSITNPAATKGTIVFFTGGDGESAAAFPADEQTFAPQYTLV